MINTNRPLTLLTGGSGFVGSHVAEELLNRGMRVRCIVRAHSGWLTHLPVEICRVGFDDLPGIENALSDVDYIVHVAGVTKAKSRSGYWKGNVEPTRQLLQAAARVGRVKKFCLISSLAAVGPNTDSIPVNERSECHPLTAYGRSKREAELICASFNPQVPIVIVRPPAVYGPRDRDVFELFRWVSYGVKPVIGKAEKRLSLVFAPDLAKGIVEVLLSERTSGETYFISDPTSHTFTEQVDTVAALAHRKPIPIYFPAPLLYAIAGAVEAISFFGSRPAVLSLDKARDLLQEHWECSAEKITREIGFVCPTPFREGLRKTYDWYREMKWL